MSANNDHKEALACFGHEQKIILNLGHNQATYFTQMKIRSVPEPTKKKPGRKTLESTIVSHMHHQAELGENQSEDLK